MTCNVGDISIGRGHPLTIIGGPCVLESLNLGLEIGQRLMDACADCGLAYIFKASFDKANRSSIASPRGPGLAQGLQWLGEIRERLGAPITTDVHEAGQAAAVADAVDLLQVPAFLCRQTDLLVSCGEAANRMGRAVNIKKGQFLSPAEMRGPIRKLAEAGCENVLLTERGTFFGYHRLVNDFTGLGDLMELGPPVCFDVTHSTQLPGSGDQTGGRPERAPLLARAAVAAGVDALFLECHPEPAMSLSDAATTLTPAVARGIIESAARIRAALV